MSAPTPSPDNAPRRAGRLFTAVFLAAAIMSLMVLVWSSLQWQSRDSRVHPVPAAHHGVPGDKPVATLRLGMN